MNYRNKICAFETTDIRFVTNYLVINLISNYNNRLEPFTGLTGLDYSVEFRLNFLSYLSPPKLNLTPP